MKIVYLAGEVAPFFKTGGLADVMGALPKKMAELGHEVSVIMPKYDKIPVKYLEKLEWVARLESHGDIFNLVKYPDEKINYYFLENAGLYERGRVYGDDDEDIQYAMFSELSLRFLKEINLQPDILHCNDWQTGPVPYFLNVRYNQDPFYWDIRTVYSIHNLMYQGRFSKRSFERMGYYIHGNSLNFMEIGIGYSDVANTVSPTYAEEIKYPYFAEGLEWITNNKKIYGILNGIDTDEFNPEKTEGIIHFNKDSLDKKRENKYRLQEKLGLPKSDNAMISIVTRLVEGKGLDLVSAGLENLLKYDAVQIVILGSGDKKYENYYDYLAVTYPDKFKVYLGYNAKLANEIYAGSDMFLMPSRYEPCGLSQMIAMRFGTVAIVRETGGLKDTVKPYNIFADEGNGFSFTNFNADDMLFTIKVAEGIYYDRPDIWEKLVKRNMELDFSWDKAANEYLELYKEAKTH